MTRLPQVPDPFAETGYAYLPHTADLRLLGWGPDFPEAVRQVLLGTAALLAAPLARRRAVERTVRVAASDRIGAAVQAANELLFLFDADGLVLGDVQVEEAAPNCQDEEAGCVLRLTFWGDHIAEGDEYTPTCGVKAATYHQARVEVDGGRWTVEMTLDL